MSVKKIAPTFTDARGSIYDILEDTPVGHIGMITSKKGFIRGKHYHKQSTQYTFVVNGRLEFLTRNMRDSHAKSERVILERGDLVETPPLVAHAMRFLEDSTLLDFTTKSRTADGYENDTVRVEMEGL